MSLVCTSGRTQLEVGTRGVNFGVVDADTAERNLRERRRKAEDVADDERNIAAGHLELWRGRNGKEACEKVFG